MKKNKKHISKKSKRTVYIVVIFVVVVAALFIVETLRPGTIPILSKILADDPPTDNVKDIADNVVPSYIDIATSLAVYFIDVGQGDSILLRFAGGVDVLIDAGSGANAGAARVADYLDALSATGLDNIEYLIATHPDSDHINMLDDVLDAYEVQNIYYNGNIHDTKTFESFAKAAQEEMHEGADANITLFDEDGDIYKLLQGDYSLTLYAPGYQRFTDANSMSPIIIVEYGGRKIVLTGDAEAETEKWFVEIMGEGSFDADILKVGHHGSESSTSDIFLDFITCEYAVISVGEGNTYGHPHNETLYKLAADGYSVYRTDISGTVVAYIDTDGDIAFVVEKTAQQ